MKQNFAIMALATMVALVLLMGVQHGASIFNLITFNATNSSTSTTVSSTSTSASTTSSTIPSNITINTTTSATTTQSSSSTSSIASTTSSTVGDTTTIPSMSLSAPNGTSMIYGVKQIDVSAVVGDNKGP